MELQLTMPAVKQRLEMYKRAEASASQAGDAFKARRFSRGLATLKRLKANLEAGRGVSEEDIPPPISMKPPERTNDQLQPQPPSRHQQEVLPAPIVSPVQIGQDQPHLMQPAPQRLPSPKAQPNSSGVPPSDHVIQPAVVSHQQVWSLPLFYSVDFLQTRIGVKKCISTNAQSRFASVVFDVVLGPPRLARHT